MINIALIGISGYGASHLKLIRAQEAAGKARLVAATVINRSETEDTCRELEAAGCTLFEDYRDMLETFRGKIDLCCIPTGIHWHTPMTVDALNSGAHVLVEKPIAATLQEVDAIRKASASTGKFVAVGFQNTYNPNMHALKRALLDGVIGKVTGLKTLGLFARTHTYYARNNWAGKLKNNGHWVLDSPANNALSHPLNQMLFLAGESMGQSAVLQDIQAEMYRAKPIESFDTVTVRVTTAQHASILFAVTHSCPESRDTVTEITGEKGRIQYSATAGIHLLEPNGGSRRMDELEAFSGDPRGPMMDAVLNKITRPDIFVCTPDIAGRHTQCINAMHQFFPIHDVPQNHIHKDESIITINGMEDTLRDAYTRNCLLSESGSVPWAKPSKVVSITNYATFKGLVE